MNQSTDMPCSSNLSFIQYSDGSDVSCSTTSLPVSQTLYSEGSCNSSLISHQPMGSSSSLSNQAVYSEGSCNSSLISHQPMGSSSSLSNQTVYSEGSCNSNLISNQTMSSSSSLSNHAVYSEGSCNSSLLSHQTMSSSSSISNQALYSEASCNSSLLSHQAMGSSSSLSNQTLCSEGSCNSSNLSMQTLYSDVSSSSSLVAISQAMCNDASSNSNSSLPSPDQTFCELTNAALPVPDEFTSFTTCHPSPPCEEQLIMNLRNFSQQETTTHTDTSPSFQDLDILASYAAADSLTHTTHTTATSTETTSTSVVAAAVTDDDDVPPPKVKKKRRRTKNPDPPPEAILPPCKVCDDKSSGYHYGVNTCEACKGFFRRTLKKKDVGYKCKCKSEEKNHWKNGPTRNGCPACRYERCLDVGMSRNAIKIGRYTIDHKTNNIREAKTIENKQKVKQAQISMATQGTLTLPAAPGALAVDNMPSVASDISKLERIIEAAFAQAVIETSTESISGDSGYESPNLHTMLAASADSIDLLADPHLQAVTSCTDLIDLTENTFDTSEPPLKKRFTESMPEYLKAGLTLKEIDTTIKTLTEAHSATLIDNEIQIKDIRKKQTEYLEQYKLKTQLFGDMKNLTRAEFFEFYNTTGIDIDGRMEDVDKACAFFEKKIALMVAFGKAIPGFKKLNIDDQANLIKCSRLENMFLASNKQFIRNVDIKRKVLMAPWGKQCHFDEIAQVCPKEFMDMRLHYSTKLQNLDLSIQEEATVRAILITFTDRMQLHEPDKITSIQEKLVFCLQHLLNVRHGGPGTLFYKIFDLITDLRIMVERETQFTEEVIKEPIMSDKLSKYSLLREFMT